MNPEHGRAAKERDHVGGESADEPLIANDPADERLARQADEDRAAEPPKPVEVPDAGVVLLWRFAKSDAGIEKDAAERHPRARCKAQRTLEGALDVVENVDRRIHGFAVVHDDDSRGRLRDGVRHAGVAPEPPDVVDDRGAETRRLSRHRRLAGVD